MVLNYNKPAVCRLQSKLAELAAEPESAVGTAGGGSGGAGVSSITWRGSTSAVTSERVRHIPCPASLCGTHVLPG